MSQIKITADNLSNIAAKLDAAGANLSVDERGLLASVFQAAALQIHADVQGFSYAHVDTGLGGAFGSIFTGPGVETVSAGAAGASANVTSNPGSGAGAGITVPGVGSTNTYVVV